MRILIAEDDPTSLLVLRHAVERLGHECLLATDGAAAWDAFVAHAPDVVITDWMMPGVDGPELVRRVRESDRYSYVIMLTALSDHDHALAGMSAGADGYLTKPLDNAQLKLGLVAAARMTDLHRRLAAREGELEALNARLADESRRDPLTGLGNRLRMTEDLDRLDDAHRRYGRAYALALVDVDRFKRYNDRYGHAAGDEALRRVAATLAAGVRTADDVYRYGGEEILVVLPEQTLDGARDAMERLRGAVSALGIEHADNPPLHRLTISAGLAAVPTGAHAELAAVLRDADDALYAAKAAGRDRVELAGGEAPAPR
ncbi:MAG TPA: diguanylate cyclase [Solirubrobacteraceae bacterium]|nr:diguanylate cyclase [Solirubrobacteraceae bacterium]